MSFLATLEVLNVNFGEFVQFSKAQITIIQIPGFLKS